MMGIHLTDRRAAASSDTAEAGRGHGMSAKAEELWVESYNATTKRHAIFEDDGLTAWLHLHAPTDDPRHSGPAEKTCFVYNRRPPIDVKDVQKYPPPAAPPIAKGYASDCAVCRKPKAHEWTISWERKGKAVRLSRDGQAWCLMEVGGDKYGFCRSIKAEGPWGSPWDQQRFERMEWAVE
jgi:hypothetical protein